MIKRNLLFLLLPLIAGVVSGCDGAPFVDYVEQTKLTAEYEGRDFLADGIGEVTLFNTVDGDTAHFTSLISEDRIKARFIGVDTPESTGQIQPWGKAASKFTAEKLNAAKVIVLSSESEAIGPAVADSTGSRYLSFIWVAFVENPSLSDFKMINLWLVQESYSGAKGISDSRFSQVFYDADMQSQALAIRIWSEDPDPDFYYGAATVTSIKEVVEDPETWIDAKVYLEGIVAKTIGTDAYINLDIEDEETGVTQRYGLYVFSQYKSYAPLLTIGNLVGLTGIIASFNGNLQMVDVKYSPYYPGPDDIKLITAGNAIEPLVITAAQGNDPKYINVVVTVNNLHGTGGYKEDDSNAMTINCMDNLSGAINLRISDNVHVYDRAGSGFDRILDPLYFQVEGETFNVTGALLRYESLSGNVSYQVSLCKNADLVFNS
ncbi:MAG: thermonuclease family protein [Bacilli bacterium]|jgi:micrococcal nuclease